MTLRKPNWKLSALTMLYAVLTLSLLTNFILARKLMEVSEESRAIEAAQSAKASPVKIDIPPCMCNCRVVVPKQMFEVVVNKSPKS